MTEAELIQYEVMRRADLQNGEIIAEYLMKDSAKCMCCNYPLQMAYFKRVLSAYTFWKIQAHKWERRWNGRWYDDFFLISTPNKCYENADEFAKQSFMHAFYKAQQCRDYLNKIMPCFRCRLKYNPTYKTSYMGKIFESDHLLKESNHATTGN